MTLRKVIDYRKKMEYFTNYLMIGFSLVMPINAYLGRQMFSVIGIFWLFSVDYNKIFLYIKENKIFQVFLLFSIFFILSVLWSNDYYLGMKWVQIYSKYFFFPIVVFVTISRYEFLKYIITAFIFSMMVNEIMSYCIFFGHIKEVFGYEVVGNFSNPVPFQNYGRHISYSLYIAFTIFLILFSFLSKTNIVMKFFGIIFIFTMTANLFLSSGRTGQFMFIMTSIFLVMIYFRHRAKYFFFSLIILVGIIFIAYNSSNTFKTRIFQAKSDFIKTYELRNYNSSFGVRLGSYVVLPDILTNINILTGTGVGDIQRVVSEATAKRFGVKTMFSHQQGLMHNTFLEIFVSLGIVGLSLFCYFLFLIVTSVHVNKYYTYISYLVFCIFVFSGISASFFSFFEIMLLLSLFMTVVIVSNQYTVSYKKGNIL